MTWWALLLLAAAPFWESKAPQDWTETELITLFTRSPWGQLMTAAGNTSAPAVQIFLATAEPMRQAESERNRRHRRKRPDDQPDVLAEDYRAWLEENRATQIVIAVYAGDARALSDDRETRQMEEECVMRVGRKKIKMSGHFPPSSSDPYLRLAFPRQVTAADKTVTFELYLPGVPMPFRSAEFAVKDMVLQGKLEM